jgi:hypothetical protein
MLYFNNCDIQINGTGLMAQNARLSSSNSLEVIKPIGRKAGLEASPEGPVQNNFSATYWIDIDNDPCYRQTLRLRDSTDFEQSEPQVIEIAGLSGAFYLQNYSIVVRENSTIQANVTYQGYEEMSGSVSPRDEVLNYVSGFSGLAHSWTTFLESDAGSVDIPILRFDYNFSSRLNPIYAIGAKTPIQVVLTSFEEEIKIVKDTERQIVFHGESGCVLFDSCANNPYIKILKLGYLCDDSLTDAMTFSVDGYKVRSNTITADTNDFVKSEFTIIRTN